MTLKAGDRVKVSKDYYGFPNSCAPSLLEGVVVPCGAVRFDGWTYGWAEGNPDLDCWWVNHHYLTKIDTAPVTVGDCVVIPASRYAELTAAEAKLSTLTAALKELTA